jgi:hypothetical protein
MKIYSSKYYKKIKTGGKMKRVHFLLFTVCCLLLTVFLWSCGSGPGSPGSSGSEDTGIIVDAPQVTGLYNGTNTDSVDVFQEVCDPGPPPKYEIFTDHQATATFTARLVNPDTTFQVGNLYIDKYTIEFRRSTDSIGAPPIESDKRFETITIPAPVGAGTTTVTVSDLSLVDLIRKEQYANDMLSGRYSSSPSYINNYTAIYTFYGKNDFGKEFKIKATMNFQIGDFDYCTGG